MSFGVCIFLHYSIKLAGCQALAGNALERTDKKECGEYQIAVYRSDKLQ
jgi:hypothetical protein